MEGRQLAIRVLGYGLMFLGFSFIIGGSVRRFVPVVVLGLFGVYWGMRFLRLAGRAEPPADPADR